ncbi:MAG: aminotransferase class V-fold PLP-dependent enzyme, partial [Clostridia bacterium]|nr:aminotransferase class V-fold PLP-dependent enzyme [Clostridia bacterium]
MERGGLIYFDNAATSFPKPRSVIEETVRCMTEYGGNAGRGTHALARAAAEKIYECRRVAAEHFGVDDPSRVLFTLNTTTAINTVLKGLLRRGDHVLLSDIEHNAVLRPLARLEREGRITCEIFPSMLGDDRHSAVRICAGIAKRIKKETRMVVCSHASNLCSLTMPLREIGAFCHRHGLLFVVDGAQSAGHERIKVDEMAIDALCVPSHKGLYGPQGGGMILLGKGITTEMLGTLVEGGNGMASLSAEMSSVFPERYEAGTLPTPVIAGLCEGIRVVEKIGVDEIAAHERSLYLRMREVLGNTKGVTLYAPEYEGAVLLFNIDGQNAERVGRL